MAFTKSVCEHIKLYWIVIIIIIKNIAIWAGLLNHQRLENKSNHKSKKLWWIRLHGIFVHGAATLANVDCVPRFYLLNRFTDI